MAEDFSTVSTESSTLLSVSEDPLCREASLRSLDSWITPTERFYVRNHFLDVPELDSSTWHLAVDGQVDTPLNLSLADVLARPSKEMVMTMECAGNSRSYTIPPSEGLAFGHGAVSTARWRGVLLSDLLDLAGLKPTAHEVVFIGADHGNEEEDGVEFQLEYRRSLPLEKALHPDTLLAYQMNGKALTPDHGYPLRLVVPGWYAMASVKWLVGITVLDRPFDGFFQKRRYVVINEGVENTLDREPVTTLKVKSLITSPRHGEVIQKGPITIEGLAWSGNGAIGKVEVTVDGGRSWREVTLLGESHSNAWRQWKYDWRASSPGHYIFMARATDSKGNTQPASIPWNFRGYANNSIHTIAVEVPSSPMPGPS